MIPTRAIPLALIAGLALGPIGCGQQDEEGQAAPPSEAVTQSAVAGQAMEKAGEAVTDALVEQNSNVAWIRAPRAESDAALATMWPLAMGERLQAVAVDGFEFDSSFTILVDLDAAEPGGSADRYPNATGSVLVEATATGDTDACLASGSVAYTVDLTVQDDVVVTDPNNGASVTWPSGGAAAWTVDVVWAWSNASNWSYEADVTKDVDGRSVSVTTAGGDTFDAVVDVHHEATRTVNVVGGTWNSAFTWTGTRHAVWTAPSGNTYDVTWDVESLFEIHLTVNQIHYDADFVVEVQTDGKWKSIAEVDAKQEANNRRFVFRFDSVEATAVRARLLESDRALRICEIRVYE